MPAFSYLFIAAIAVWLWALMAWVTHIVVCIKAANWLFLIAGAVAPPVGIIHGTGVWFGAW